MSKLDGQSFDNVHARIEELKRLFPEAVSEGRLDYDSLMTLLGDEFDNDDEKYQFTWKGKLDSLKLAQKRSGGTLRPDFDESRDFEATGNLYIEGDNLEVLKLLQQSYLRQVKMIYIDPPYNTGNDFVYEDDFADPIARYKKITGQGMRANPETAGRYHSNWLSMMYPRLRLAKTLLRDDGLCFISIDDIELEKLKMMCNEVFGEENFVKCIVWKNRYGGGAKEKHFVTLHEYILIYARNIDALGELFMPLADDQIEKYYKNRDDKYESRGPYRLQPLEAAKTLGERKNLVYPITAPDGSQVYPKRQWLWAKERVEGAIQRDELSFTRSGDSWSINIKQYLRDVDGNTRPGKMFSILDGYYTQHATQEITQLIGDAQIFSYPKPSSLVKELITLGSDADSIIIDYFSGSATTAHAVMQLNTDDGGNRKFIMVQIPEPTAENSEARKAGYTSIADIGKERIRRAGDKIMAEWREKHSQTSMQGDVETPPDIGFRVFKLDTSNQIVWDDSYVPPDQIDLFFERMERRVDSIKPDRRAIDMVYEIMLKYGQSLTENIAQLDISDKTFYVVGETGCMFICLEPDVTAEMVEEAAAYTPGVMIFATNCFADSSEIINAGLILDKAKIEFRWV